MCGIVGYVTPFRNGFSRDEVDAFRDMLFLDTKRGWDATGVFGVDNNLNVAVLKEASCGPDFIRTKEFDSFTKEAVSRGQILVGHNRAATRGDSTKDENAHPFHVEDKIVLVQNGTYHGSWKHHANTEVDSEAIAHCLAKEPDISKALQTVNAAYALVWYDVSKSTLNIIRNSQRPMYLAKTKRGGLMFASEAATIYYAAISNSLPIENAPEMLPAGELVQITLDEKWGWKCTRTTIDYAYKSTFQSRNDEDAYDVWLRQQGPYHGYHNRGDGWYERPQQQQRVTYASGSTGAAHVAKTVRDVLEQRPSSWMTPNEQEACFEWGKKQAGRKVLIEVLDYAPMNDHRDCKAWTILGKPIDPAFAPGEATPILYWIVCDKDEIEIVDLCTTEYFVATGNNVIKSTFNKNNEVQHIAYMFAATPVPATVDGYEYDATTH